MAPVATFPPWTASAFVATARATICERRFPLRYCKIEIGLLTVIALVILRLSIGGHFLFEGVWKIRNPDKFSTRPFLTQAKGPAAPLFYAMVPDLDGRRRLKVDKNEEGRTVVRSDVYLAAWKELSGEVLTRYKPSEEQKKAIDELLKRYEVSLEEYLGEHGDDIVAYFDSLDRFEAYKAGGNNGAPFQKKRKWDRMQQLRREVNVWLSELDAMGKDYRSALSDLLDDDQKQREGTLPAVVLETEKLPVPVPGVNTQSELFDLLLTYGLTAIGLCLVLGLFSRLASLGGVVFLFSVLLTQPPWPTIYPPAPAVVGHALLVDKNFVEMVALLVLASTAVGRWGGLDFFIYRWIGKPILSRCRKKEQDK